MTTHLDTRAVARALGGEVVGRSGISAPGPGHSRSDRSLSVRIDPRAPGGFVVFSHAGDDPIGCRDYVRQRCGLPQWNQGAERSRPDVRTTPAAKDDDDTARRTAFALKLWAQSVSPSGTLVERYLASRGLVLTGDMGGRAVRYHGALRLEGQTIGGMVLLMRDVITDQPTGIHRTFLAADGMKIDRRMLGIARDTAIKLATDTDVTDTLVIGEGFESCLAAHMAGFKPVWAVGSAIAITNFPLMRRIRDLTILEENDAASANAVDACGQRWHAAGRFVRAARPKIGNDMNDLWRAFA